MNCVMNFIYFVSSSEMCPWMCVCVCVCGHILFLHLVQPDRWNRMSSSFSHQVHLELLYCPFGMESEFTNPFADQKFTLTTLEKSLKREVAGTETAQTDRTSTLRKKDVIVRGVLSVTVVAAEDLPVMDVLGKADPYVVITMKKTETRNKTRVTFCILCAICLAIHLL